MKKIILTFVLYFLSIQIYAKDIGRGIVDLLISSMKIEALQASILNGQTQQLNVERDILSTQRDIDNLMRNVNSNISGNSGWGTFRLHDYSSYGESSRDWSSVIAMADSGNSSGELGQMIRAIVNQFPIDKSTFNRGITDSRTQVYYALKSQTILATRAASQLDYNKIQAQIEYQQMLQYQIEKSPNLKAALDLNNRLQFESNLIQLEILRQIALTNQQQAVSEEASLNTALSLAKFLTK
jgi:hypothetical protein